MTNWRAGKILGCGTLTWVALLSFGCRGTHESRAGTTTEPTHGDMAALSPSPKDLEDRAWKILSAQVNGNYSPEKPSWDTKDWFSKSSVPGLTAPDRTAMFRSVSHPANLPKDALRPDSQNGPDPETLEVLSDSVRVPVQDFNLYLNGSLKQSAQLRESDSINAFVNRLASNPAQFAAVRFNREALISLRDTVKSWKEGKLNVALIPGSILAKAIWTAIPVPQNETVAALDMYTYPLPKLCCGPQEKGQTELLAGSDFYKATLDLRLDPDDRACLPNYDNEVSQHIPPGCFHYYPVKANSKAAQTAQSEIARLSSKLANAKCPGMPCYLVLTGIHFMVRLGPGDPLYSNEHHWLFITLWWNGRDNGHISELPWKYYQITVTQQERDDSDGITHERRNYLFNPYLEGPNLNGAVANCMTCHQFAKVMPDQKSGSLMGLGAGECLGGSTPGKIGSCGLKESEYLTKCGVDSDFVWSIANLNRGNGPLPPPCDKATPSYFFTTH